MKENIKELERKKAAAKLGGGEERIKKQAEPRKSQYEKRKTQHERKHKEKQTRTKY